VLDLDAYLARIGLAGRPGLAAVHRAHSTAIPFENLDPHRGVPVSLAIEDIERKLVHQRRGGYCFEQNLLLKAALEQLGAEVDIYLARVRFGAPPGVIRPRGHLVLRARGAWGELHADVGFGLGTLFEPLPWGPGAAHEQCGWRYRVVEDGEELVLQGADGGGWFDLYGFPPLPGDRRLKIATEQYETSTTADAMDRFVDPAESARMYRDHVRGRVAGVTPRVVQAAACLYTGTPDRGFIIDRHPDQDRVFVISACSGHGFKHSAGIGNNVAEKVAEGRSLIDLSPFSVSRFATNMARTLPAR